nr:hypothetical protein [Tanacetum cinerariifolium]
MDEETYPLFLDKDGEDMDIFAFIHTSDPTKVKVIERERKEDELRLLETTVGHIVPLLPVAPDRDESELDANVDKLLDEGGSGSQAEQGDSASGGGEQGMNIQPVTETTDVVAEDVIPLQLRRLKKRKSLVSDAGGPSHPLKKLREDHGTPSGTSVGGKSMSAVQRLFARAVQNAEVRGEPIPTMPFITSYVSATSERKGEGHTDSITRRNLLTISALQRPSAPVITAATTITSTADPAVVIKEKIVKPSLFAAESTSANGTDPVMAGLTDLAGSDFLMSLSAEVRVRAEYNIREKRRLKSVVKKKNQFLKARDEEIENLKAWLLLNEAEATKAIRLHTKVSKLEILEKSLRDEVNALNERNSILKKERNALDEGDRPGSYSCTRIFTHGMELSVVKCLNSPGYLFALGTAVSKAIEKGTQDGLVLGITHDREGRALTDLKTNKDASIEAVINILRLEEHLAERLGLTESQPHVDQLMVPIHHSSDKTVVGVFTLSLALDVSDSPLTGMEGTSNVVPATADITTTLSVTLASAGTITPFFVDDYGVMGMNDQLAVDEDANPFPNVDDAKLNIP